MQQRRLVVVATDRFVVVGILYEIASLKSSGLQCAHRWILVTRD